MEYGTAKFLIFCTKTAKINQGFAGQSEAGVAGASTPPPIICGSSLILSVKKAVTARNAGEGVRRGKRLSCPFVGAKGARVPF